MQKVGAPKPYANIGTVLEKPEGKRGEIGNGKQVEGTIGKGEQSQIGRRHRVYVDQKNNPKLKGTQKPESTLDFPLDVPTMDHANEATTGMTMIRKVAAVTRKLLKTVIP